MHKVYEVFGLLEDEQEVDATVRDLKEHGIADEEIQVITPAAGRYWLADERLHEEVVGLEHGAIKGAMAGAVAGLIAAFATMDGFGIPAMLMVILFFAGMGALVGGMAGMQAREHHDDDIQATRDVLAPAAARVVAVRSDHRSQRAHRILERHGALFLEEPHPHTS